MRVGPSGLALLAVLLFTACGDPTGHTLELVELQSARDRWTAERPAAYEVTIFRGCECLPEMTGPVAIVVRNGVVESRSYPATGGAVGPTYATAFPTVDGLFDLILQAAGEGVARLEANYHPTLGYPLQVRIDYHPVHVDDEVTYTLSNLRAR